MEEIKEIKFDEALQQLESIISKLETGNLPLEESIELYKKGKSLSTFCHHKLQRIETEIIKLVDESGNIGEFDEDGDAAG